jgi:hypothetical protein
MIRQANRQPAQALINPLWGFFAQFLCTVAQLIAADEASVVL